MKKDDKAQITISRAFFDKRGGDGRTPWTVSIRHIAPPRCTRVWVLRFSEEHYAAAAVEHFKKELKRPGNTLAAFLGDVELVQHNVRMTLASEAAERSRQAYERQHAS